MIGPILQRSFSSHLLTKASSFGFSSATKKVLLFGGQGNQQKGMLDKFTTIPQALNIINSSSQNLNIDLLQLATTDSSNLINTTSHTQPLLLLSQYLEFFYGQKSAELKQVLNNNPFDTFCIGHSLGEYTALVIAGSISLNDCLKLVHKRGQLMIKSSQSNTKLGTLIIKFREDKLPKIIEKVKQLNLQISCYNSPTNIVVSGEIDNLTELKTYMKAQLRIVSKVLPAATAFHSSHLQGMKAQFHQTLSKIPFQPPKMKILRNLDCKVYSSKEDILQGLTQQNTNPVLFTQSVEKLVKQEGKENLEFVQIGHKEYLNRWVDEVRKLFD